MIALAPCKINIGLKILDKRDDGYHNIDSYFYAVPLYDIIEIQEDKEDKLIQTGIVASPKAEDNIVFQALKFIRHHYHIPPIHIHLHKQIPTQAGLGGGSSDASIFLKLLRNYLKLGISDAELFQIALGIGSDCPFFLNAQAARIQGRGELVLPWDFSLKSKYIVIVKPPFSMNTQEAYYSNETRHNELLPNITDISFDDWKHVFTNDFEEIVIKKYPSMRDIKKILWEASAFYVSLSGSGSAVFGLFHSQVNIKLPPSYFVWKCQL